MIPPPESSPQPPSPADGDSGVRPAMVRDIREAIEAAEADKPSTIKVALIAGITLLGGAGGAIVFLLAFAGESRAQAVSAAQAIVTVQAQRGDVLASELAAQKARLEAIDAGVAAKLEQLESKVEQARQRSEQRADAQEQMLREVLREVRKR